MANSPEATWQDLSNWLNHWYYEPDLDALKICLCGLTAHYYPEEDPLWLLVIGSSGSGKTDIITQSLSSLPDAQVVGSLSPKCFLSGMQAKNETSMLIAGGPSQIWIAKDFTTFASMRLEARSEVASYLREIWDGRFSAHTGAGVRSWQGKVTLLAVATPAFEEYWAAMRQLGDRFMTVRWRNAGDQQGIMQKMRMAAGQKKEIREQTRAYVEELIANRWTTGAMPSSKEMVELDATAEMVGRLQTTVPRHNDAQRSIKTQPDEEVSSRLGFALSQLVRTYNDLFHGAPGGVMLAKRLAFDTIPMERRRILSVIPSDGDATYAEILKGAGVPRTTLRRELEGMCWIGVLEFPDEDREWPTRVAKFTSKFKKILSQSCLILRKRGEVLPMRPILARSGHKANFPVDYY